MVGLGPCAGGKWQSLLISATGAHVLIIRRKKKEKGGLWKGDLILLAEPDIFLKYGLKQYKCIILKHRVVRGGSHLSLKCRGDDIRGRLTGLAWTDVTCTFRRATARWGQPDKRDSTIWKAYSQRIQPNMQVKAYPSPQKKKKQTKEVNILSGSAPWIKGTWPG